MRRKDREITDFNEIIEIIKKCDVCRIAMNDGDFPYIVPLNFGLDVQDGRACLRCQVDSIAVMSVICQLGKCSLVVAGYEQMIQVLAYCLCVLYGSQGLR